MEMGKFRTKEECQLCQKCLREEIKGIKGAVYVAAATSTTVISTVILILEYVAKGV